MDRREPVCMVVILLAAALVCASAASAGALPFEDGFEFTPAGIHPDGWQTLSTGKGAYVVEGISAGGSKSFGLDSLPWAAQVESVSLDETPDRVTYEAAVRLDAFDGWMATVGFLDQCGGSVPMWNFFCIDGSSGAVRFCGEDRVDLAAISYTPGTWCTVRAELDFAALTADLRVTTPDDDVLIEDVPIAPKQLSCAFVSENTSDRWGVAAPSTPAFSNLVYFDNAKVFETETTIPVTIDIKPGSEENPINLRSNGLLPVCVFSSDTFDATAIDPATCLLAGAPVAATGTHLKPMAHPEDLDEDGLTDMLLQFETQQLDPEQMQDGYAVLSGATLQGSDFLGLDEVTLLQRPIRARGRR